MSRIAYVNGAFLPLEEAKVSILDRGFLFADGIYEVTTVLDGKLVDEESHAARLARCLGEIALAMPFTPAEMGRIFRELVARNELAEGLIYLQITRGAAADRDFPFPPADVKPTVVMFTMAKNLLDNPGVRDGVKVLIVPDIRWQRRDIKSIALLAQVLAKQAAAAAGCAEAWMVEEGCITEGGSSNAFIVLADGTIVTRQLSNAILPGCTRKAVLKLAAEHQIKVVERPFTVEEAKGAMEAFVTSASTFVLPVVQIDDTPVGNGTPGPLTRRLREIYLEFARGEGAS